MYYTVIKHSGYLTTLEKCRKHSPAACVVYISLVFSNARRVLSQCNTWLRLLYLLYNIYIYIYIYILIFLNIYIYIYILLTKCEVKMAGYWPCCLFAFLWTEPKSRTIRMQKENKANLQLS